MGHEKILGPLIEDTKTSFVESQRTEVSSKASLKFCIDSPLTTFLLMVWWGCRPIQHWKNLQILHGWLDNINMLSDFTVCTLHTPDNYQQHLALLSSDSTQRQQVGQDYGVVSRCVFSEILNTDITAFSTRWHARFHEDVVQVVSCVALADIIAKIYLNIQLLHNLLTIFKYGQCDNRDRYGAKLTMPHIRTIKQIIGSYTKSKPTSS